MRKEYFPYYISRAVISSGFAVLIMGVTWSALATGLILFALFLLYLHSGWFAVDLTHPVFPLRRDTRGVLIQRKALIGGVLAGLATHLVVSNGWNPLTIPSATGSIALSIGILIYFTVQIVLFIKA